MFVNGKRERHVNCPGAYLLLGLGHGKFFVLMRRVSFPLNKINV